MNPGRLDTPVRVDTLVKQKTSLNQVVEEWTEGTVEFGNVKEPSSGGENQSANQNQHRVSYQVTVRWRPGLSPATANRYRVVLVESGEILDIAGVSNLGGREAWLVIQGVVRPEDETSAPGE